MEEQEHRIRSIIARPLDLLVDLILVELLEAVLDMLLVSSQSPIALPLELSVDNILVELLDIRPDN